jgi:enoyl-[acyl-carrier-protein] reductase (NADH)
VAELAQFYLEEAPLAGWQKQSVTQDEGAELVFTKPDKRLEVTVRPLSFGRGRRLVLTLLPDAS